MSAARSTFVKASKTSTPAANSRRELENMLRRYGATGLNWQQTWDAKTGVADKITVTFILPDKPGSSHHVPVQIPVDVKHVYDGMYGRPTKRLWDDTLRVDYKPEPGGYRWVDDPDGYDRKKLEQAERVAWRNLIVWVDAALSAATIGLQTITEAFYAHNLIALEGGGHARLSEVVERMQAALPPGVRALLASEAETE